MSRRYPTETLRSDGVLSYHPVETARLVRAALGSIALPVDRNTGARPGDPLTDLVTASTWSTYVEAAETITGHPINRDRAGDMAARVRSAMRRWAVTQ